ncbi:uncharacterized protein CDAR_70391 [Caerostris darwini]|uniref:Uncharacterized protein n=1 Tax=Caerostris darwini TaxID=1538125 RepID=A0AAV4PFV0_9ARAC|nr:uncharacterized protein CDAR_70391 [Caerostris darwini]
MSCNYYIKDTNGVEQYCRTADGDEYYIETDDATKVFASDAQGNKRYAKDHENNEIYPIVKDQPVFLIDDQQMPHYAKTTYGSEVYPRLDSGKQLVATDGQNNAIYAKNLMGEYFYPRDEKGDEYVLDEMKMIKELDGTTLYPLDRNGNPQYTKFLGQEIYEPLEGHANMVSFGKNIIGDEVYAKNFDGDEYYPSSGQYAKSSQGIPLYAVDTSGHIIFPKDSNGKEVYLKDSNFSDIFFQRGNYLKRYAFNEMNDEYYPSETIEIQNNILISRNVILNERYAETQDGEIVYPLDENNNEFTLDLEQYHIEDALPIGYPITNDSFIIVPNVNNKPFIVDTIFPDISERNIRGKLARDSHSNDFVTNVRSPRISQVAKKRYTTIPWLNYSRPPDSNLQAPKPNPPIQKNVVQPPIPIVPVIKKNIIQKKGWSAWILGILVGLIMIGLLILKWFIEKNLTRRTANSQSVQLSNFR